jgi:hypothetical protein
MIFPQEMRVQCTHFAAPSNQDRNRGFNTYGAAGAGCKPLQRPLAQARHTPFQDDRQWHRFNKNGGSPIATLR